METSALLIAQEWPVRVVPLGGGGKITGRVLQGTMPGLFIPVKPRNHTPWLSCALIFSAIHIRINV